jgi:hypothetical protein
MADREGARYRPDGTICRYLQQCIRNILGVPIYRASGVYNIEAGEYIYVCHESLRWRTSKPAALTVNGPVQFSVEGDTLYLKDDNGREHKTKIVKKILKEPKAKQ